MGASFSTAGNSSVVSRCDERRAVDNGANNPPPMRRVMTVEERMWQKCKDEPLVPIGCAATAYFLASGIKSFQNQDPRRGQKMMRLRVGAQFATLAMFVFYVGLDNINFEIAPQYQRAKKEEEERRLREQQQ
ncbi:unnamed protein product [Pseudo-nitzschia multistriata]|uniref:HIG1 domain-containing protein n=1 Tax=Pseudo-nitzschia multistriata TaxID=183589 RepID=A0A448Z6L9_9STRA|nr:unnamed protein product [Pseudo-nitzschia multistriata]